MYRFLQSKKGFTLVELMIVLVLMSLGSFALANLFKSAYTSYKKTQERYTKQEAVKSVVEYLQTKSDASISPSSRVELYNTLSVLPKAAEKGYNYLYVNPTNGFLYSLPAGYDPKNAIQLSKVRLYINFSEIPYSYTNKITGKVEKYYDQSRGVVCTVGATEDSFQYQVVNGAIQPPSSDDIYYSLDVAYHFPNMVEDGSLYVNRTRVAKTDNGDYVQSFTGTIQSTDQNACVVKYVSDITASGDSLLSDTNVKVYTCFIATASYGVNNGSGTVGLLCDFRDKCLLTNPIGTAFVKAYYKISPPIAKVIAQHEWMRATVRVMLKPVILVAKMSLDPSIVQDTAPWFILYACSVTTFFVGRGFYYRKQRKVKGSE